MGEIRDRLREIGTLTRELRKTFPGETGAFLNFMKAADEGPSLTSRERELINVGLSVAAQCEWCIAFHVNNALNAGATRDEITGAGFMAILMHGGPAFMYMTQLLRALDELSPVEE